jgi:glycosyltransferase involved in cell wall biosynthesis
VKEHKDPYFSIIIPSYNQAKYLKENLRSIERQSFSSWEAIIMDGGSTDQSVEYIKQFALKNKGKVWWQSKRDGGQVQAINEGIKKAKGVIVSYLNSDDKLTKNSLEVVHRHFLKNKTDWLYGDCTVSKAELRWTFFYKSLWSIDKWPKLLFLLNPINQPSVFLKMSFVKKIGFFDTKYKLAFDYEYWLRCVKKSKPTRIKTSLSCFRVHKEAKSSLGFEKQFNEELNALRKHRIGDGWYLLHKIHNSFVVFAYTLLK